MIERAPRIKPFAARKLAQAGEISYSGALASLGFEKRCRQIPEALGVSGIAIPFGDRQELDYFDNLAFFEESGWEMPQVEDEDYFGWVSTWLQGHLLEDRQVRVAVDVSSMSRRRIADVVEAVVSLPLEAELDVDFLYTPAGYESYDDKLQPPIFSVAPVSEFFAGWWSALDKPLFAIVGLGYELEMASGALDRLEPQEAQAFVPEGSDPRYFNAVREANRGIGDWVGVEPEEIFYSVADPFDCFRKLEARVSRLQSGNRVALIPLGPKIFALVATLTGALHQRSAQVIRVSAGKHQEALPRCSDGDLFGLTVSLSNPPSAEPAAE
jgi:hypothetical protein